MMNSMTAYAQAEKADEQRVVLVEIRSYNSRHLDIALRVPHGYAALEEKIKRLIEQKITRGRIEVTLKIIETSDEAYAFEINMPKAKAYYDSLVQLKDRFNIHSEIPVALLVTPGGVIKPAEIDRDIDACWNVVESCINDGMDDLVVMRKQEGDFISQDIIHRLELIESGIDRIERESSGLLSHYQKHLKDRITILTKGLVDIEPERIAQEAAFLADKSDISEEIVRVRSHIEQFREFIHSTEPAGRELNFLLQEFRREFNTIGSKTEKANISHIVVTVKSELEKIREQLQNVE
ncbi:MAG: YicC family protein [Desulfobacterales bacterium]|nr:MAG: YicC family protein [Desulfobacterales bacterium]